MTDSKRKYIFGNNGARQEIIASGMTEAWRKLSEAHPKERDFSGWHYLEHVSIEPTYSVSEDGNTLYRHNPDGSKDEQRIDVGDWIEARPTEPGIYIRKSVEASVYVRHVNPFNGKHWTHNEGRIRSSQLPVDLVLIHPLKAPNS